MRISVAIVMPEIGFDDEPMRPVMRDDTVEKKKPKTTISSGRQDVALQRHARREGQEQREQQRADEHDAHRNLALGAQRGGRRRAAPNPFRPSAAELTIVGIVRASVISPAASTAPAPM